MGRHRALDVAVLAAMLDYEPTTGILRWRPRLPQSFDSGGRYSAERRAAAFNAGYADRTAFTALGGDGYLYGRVLGHKVVAHRVAFALGRLRDPGENEIDHKNGVRTDNRLENLRAVPRFENMGNQKLRADNTSGVGGVLWDANRSKWRAEIVRDGQRFHLGRYSTFEEAVAAHDAAKRILGHSARHARAANPTFIGGA